MLRLTQVPAGLDLIVYANYTRDSLRLTAEREASERAYPTLSGPPDTVPIPPASLDLSSVPHRASLDEAAHGDHAKHHHAVEKGATTPDLDGVTHISEKHLPPRIQ